MTGFLTSCVCWTNTSSGGRGRRHGEGALTRSPRALPTPAQGDLQRCPDHPSSPHPSHSSHRTQPACWVLTELIEVGLNAILTRHGAHQSCFQECAPLIDQAAVAAVIILGTGSRVRSALTSEALPERGCWNQHWVGRQAAWGPANAYQADAPNAGIHGGALWRLC